MHAPKYTNPSLVVIRNFVYAKGTDGSHCACVVKDKQENQYTIQFPDGHTKMVFESDLVWVGFHGLPKPLWPTRPTVLMTGHTLNIGGQRHTEEREKSGGNLGPRTVKLMRNKRRSVESCVQMFSVNDDNRINTSQPRLVPEYVCTLSNPDPSPRSVSEGSGGHFMIFF